VIVFRSLNKDDIKKIVELELNKVFHRLVEHDLTLRRHLQLWRCLLNWALTQRWAPARCGA